MPPDRFQTTSRLASERVVQRWKDRTARVMREEAADDIDDVSEALERMLKIDIIDRLPPEAKHDSDVFRR